MRSTGTYNPEIFFSCIYSSQTLFCTVIADPEFFLTEPEFVLSDLTQGPSPTVTSVVVLETKFGNAKKRKYQIKSRQKMSEQSNWGKEDQIIQ